MKIKWESPYYEFALPNKEIITIDVTSSASAGLPPNKKIVDAIDFFKRKGVKSILDFGCGSLRHTLPLLNAGFEVCAVEFTEQFNKPKCKENLQKAQQSPNFSTLLFPNQFIKNRKKYDAVLLVYVIQTMPIPREREYLIDLVYSKMKKESYLLYMSRYGQVKGLPNERKINDGYYMNITSKNKTFYTDFKTSYTHDKFKRHKLTHIRSLSDRGTDQIFIYSKGIKSLWA